MYILHIPLLHPIFHLVFKRQLSLKHYGNYI